MFKFQLPQSSIQIILFPVNSIIFVTLIIVIAIPFSKIPQKEYSRFIFSEYRPINIILLINILCFLLLGFTSTFRYSKFWQASFSCFLLVIIVLNVLSIFTLDRISVQIDTVFPDMRKANQMQAELINSARELECSCYPFVSEWFEWTRTNGRPSCRDRLIEEIGDFRRFSRPFLISGLVIEILYSLFCLLFTIFVNEPEVNNKIED